MREIDIQIAIVEYLQIMSRKLNIMFFSTQNESFSAGKTRGQFSGADFGRLTLSKKAGLTPGVGDLEIIHKGRAYFMEVKKPGGQLSDAQKLFRQRALDCGAEYVVVKSVDDVISALMTWGIV